MSAFSKDWGLQHPRPSFQGLRARARPLWVMVCMAFSVAGHAATLEFGQCVDQALKQNPGLAASRSQIAQAQAAVDQAKGNKMPKLTLSVNGVHTNDALNAFGLKLSQRGASFADFGFADFLAQMPGLLGGTVGPDQLLAIKPDALNHPDAVTNFNTRIEAMLPLYTGGMIEGYVKQAQSYVTAAQNGDQAARQQLIFHVLQAYEGTHAARAYVDVAKQGEEAAQAYVKTIDNLVKQGVVVKSDLLTAQIFLENVRLQRKQAQDGAASALEQLHLLLGMPLSDPLDVGQHVALAPMQGDLAQWRAQALAEHPGLNAMRAQLEAADGNIQVAKSGNYPQVGVMLRQDWNDKSLGFAANSYTLGAQVSWTAFDAGVTNAAVNRATAAKLELSSRLQEAESGVAYMVSDASRKADEASKRLAVHVLSVTQAQEALKLVEKRYENGVTTLVELLAARTQLDKARADRVAAQFDVQVQRAALRLAMGRLDPDLK